ncbi:nuclear transport factor 2 family protein [Thioalkalivibrio sp.]|uniref:nuclear transport factor 2 family protein n=1 Tax=Thioalkalivibrio sp. TaxID=2093813 RepID=UPI0025F541DE|nr:nuclear transport factor 2 family protein [Thioalkalivibrio sp.]
MNLTPIEPTAVVEGYLDALAARDTAGARRYLVDNGFEYRSPIGHFQSADEFLDNMGGVAAILHNLGIVHRFAQDDVVCHVLDVTVNMTGHQTQRVVQLARVRDGRIVRLEVIFDASEFSRMIGAGGES